MAEFMEHSSGSTPRMDWQASDLVTAWQSFKQHVKFWFAGPLSKKSEEEEIRNPTMRGPCLLV